MWDVILRFYRLRGGHPAFAYAAGAASFVGSMGERRGPSQAGSALRGLRLGPRRTWELASAT